MQKTQDTYDRIENINKISSKCLTFISRDDVFKGHHSLQKKGWRQSYKIGWFVLNFDLDQK